MFRKLLISVLLLAAAPVLVHSQQIDPSYQINFSNSTGCATTGGSYNPATNTCVVPIVPNPAGAQTVTQPSAAQPLNVNYLAPQFINGVPNAAAWPTGADACTQLYNANVYAVGHNLPLVDATGFVGTVACNANPFNSLDATIGNSINLTVRFGVTHFQSTVPWVITNSGITLDGAGPASTQVEYTGSSCTGTPTSCAVLYVNTDGGSGVVASNGGPNNVVVRDMFFYGDVANVTDGVILNSSRSRFDNIKAWGAISCGLRLKGAEENTLTHPEVSNISAFFVGIDNGAHTVPSSGLCLDQDTAHSQVLAITATTITDPIMEGVSGIGIHVISGNNVVITGGTSEFAGTNGLVIDSSGGVINKNITVIGTDFEGNGPGGSSNGYDILDNGGLNVFINVLATSHCSAACTSVVLTSTGGGDLIFGGNIGDGVNNNGFSGTGVNGIIAPGFNATSATGGSATALPSQPSGYIVQQFKGANIKIPYYNF